MSEPTEERVLADLEATRAAGAEFGKCLKPGSVMALVGELGAGKTSFAQGVIGALGHPAEDVTSPTFTLVNEYRTSGARVPVFHFDFYRLENPESVIDLGWDDYLDGEGVCLVEWANLYPHLLPPETLWILLSHVDGGRRLRCFGQLEDLLNAS